MRVHQQYEGQGYQSALVGYGPELGCTLLELRQQPGQPLLAAAVAAAPGAAAALGAAAAPRLCRLLVQVSDLGAAAEGLAVGWLRLGPGRVCIASRRVYCCCVSTCCPQLRPCLFPLPCTPPSEHRHRLRARRMGACSCSAVRIHPTPPTASSYVSRPTGSPTSACSCPAARILKSECQRCACPTPTAGRSALSRAALQGPREWMLWDRRRKAQVPAPAAGKPQGAAAWQSLLRLRQWRKHDVAVASSSAAAAAAVDGRPLSNQPAAAVSERCATAQANQTCNTHHQSPPLPISPNAIHHHHALPHRMHPSLPVLRWLSLALRCWPPCPSAQPIFRRAGCCRCSGPLLSWGASKAPHSFITYWFCTDHTDECAGRQGANIDATATGI